MSVIEITVPIVSVEEMQAIWDAQPNSTVSVYDGRKLISTQPLFIPRLPAFTGDLVTSKPFVFPIEVKKAAVDRWSADLFGKHRIAGSFKTIHVIKGDSIGSTVELHGGR